MKYLIAIAFAATTFFGLSSCAKKKCYTCEHNSLPCTIDICDNKYTIGDDCAGVNTPSASGLNNDELKDFIETVGYTCKAK